MKLPLLVVTTVATADQAQALAREMVERRLAACVQVSAIRSTYRWQGAVCDDDEQRLLFKTMPDRVDALLAAIRERHPYELPALHVLPTVQADAAYADWVDQSTRPAP
jgi:periplasmic divalent cation tolerance protein